MDISRVNVHTWRQRISFVAQDPVLFPGTLPQNLDGGSVASTLHDEIFHNWLKFTRDSAAAGAAEGLAVGSQNRLAAASLSKIQQVFSM